MTDYGEIIESICDLLDKGGHPLSDVQRALLAGALSVWLAKKDEVIKDQGRIIRNQITEIQFHATRRNISHSGGRGNH